MAEGGDLCDDKVVFGREVDRTKFRLDHLTATIFARGMFKYVLTKYNLEFLLGEQQQGRHQDIDNALTPFCDHIGDAIIILSFVNRHKFIAMFELVLESIVNVEFYEEKFVVEFCKGFYLEEGLVEQFLIFCGFMIELAIFIFVKTQLNRCGSLAVFFGDVFRFVMRDTFIKKGGWREVKRKSKPWWYTYRNNLYIQELIRRGEFPKPTSGLGLEDYHNPLLEHCSDILTVYLQEMGYDLTIQTRDKYDLIPILPEVRRRAQLRNSPVCVQEDLGELEEENDEK